MRSDGSEHSLGRGKRILAIIADAVSRFARRRGSGDSTKTLATRLKKSTSDTFRFMDLPPELRDLVYAQYFNTGEVLATGNQPRSKHATAILLVNRTVGAEARDIMFREATFTVNLNPQFGRKPARDFAYYLDHHTKPTDAFAGDLAVFNKFSKFDITLAAPSSRWKKQHWQQAFASFIMLYPALPLTLKPLRLIINVGNLDPADKSTKALIRFADLARHVQPNWGRNRLAVKPSVTRTGLTDEQLLEQGLGRRWMQHLRRRVREDHCRGAFLHLLGHIAAVKKAKLVLQSSDGRRSREVNVDSLAALLKLAAGLDDGKEVWLVMETSPTRWGNEETHVEATVV